MYADPVSDWSFLASAYYVENMDWSMISDPKKCAVIIFRKSFVKDFGYPSFVMSGESIKMAHL